jgi:hypothetical protein
MNKHKKGWFFQLQWIFFTAAVALRSKIHEIRTCALIKKAVKVRTGTITPAPENACKKIGGAWSIAPVKK